MTLNTKRQCWANAYYLPWACLSIVGIPDIARAREVETIICGVFEREVLHQ